MAGVKQHTNASCLSHTHTTCLTLLTLGLAPVQTPDKLFPSMEPVLVTSLLLWQNTMRKGNDRRKGLFCLLFQGARVHHGGKYGSSSQHGCWSRIWELTLLMATRKQRMCTWRGRRLLNLKVWPSGRLPPARPRLLYLSQSITNWEWGVQMPENMGYSSF